MASKDGELQYLIIDDFSPGLTIYDYAATQYQTNKLGTASVATGCQVDQFNNLTNGPGEVGVTIADSITTNLGRPTILAMRNIGPINVFNATANGPPAIVATSDQVTLMYQYWTTAGGFFHVQSRCTTYKVWDGNAAYNLFTTNDATGFNSGTIGASPTYGWGTLDLSRANTVTPTSPGNARIIANYFGQAFAGGTQRAYPAQATPAVDSTDNIAGFASTFIAYVMAHQDRLVGMRGQNLFIPGIPYQWPASPGFPSVLTHGTEMLDFTAVNDYTTAGGLLLVVSENPTGYGSWKSVNANTLLLIKNIGGGVLISGPLEQPQVTKLPGMVSTGGLHNIGCSTPESQYVYGTPNGVHMWTGGDSSIKISNQLGEKAFWDPWLNSGGDFGTPIMYGVRGRFAYCYPFVFAPNNYYYDTRNGGWWKLNTNLTFAFFDNAYDSLSGSPGVWASPMDFASGGSQTVASRIELNQNILSGYTWTSTTLPIAVNRYINIRELNVTASGTATITLTVNTGGPGGAHSANPVTVNLAATDHANRPVTISTPIDAMGYEPTITISCGAGIATIHRVELGYLEQQTSRA